MANDRRNPGLLNIQTLIKQPGVHMSGGGAAVEMQTQRQGVNPDGFVQLAAPGSVFFFYRAKTEAEI